MNNIKLIFDDKEILIKLVDNVVTNKLIKELPMVLNFDDYSRTEKIAYIHKNYQIDSISSPCCPAKGDLMFYASWGYLALFYNDYIVSEDYVMLGKVIAGMMHLNSLKVNVRLEKVV